MDASLPSSAETVIRRQLRFFEKKKAGCLFAAAAARQPRKYGWVHRIIEEESESIDSSIRAAIAEPKTTTLSLLFPGIVDAKRLVRLIRVLDCCLVVFCEQTEEFAGSSCLGYRARVGPLLSYITGFGDFTFLPRTRRTPYVELTMRVKPRPPYEFVFKEAPPGVIHLADLDMRGMRRERLWKLWDRSHIHTEAILGAKPDLRSAARTTFSVPVELLKDA